MNSKSPSRLPLTSTVKAVGSVDGADSIKNIAKEPMLFSAGFNYAMKHGGGMTRMILREIDRIQRQEWSILQPPGRHVIPIIDTRVHMLMPGMWPAIPGWHCDHVPRKGIKQQPDLPEADPMQKNYQVLITSCGSLAPTIMLNQDIVVPFNYRNVYGPIDEYLSKKEKKLSLVECLPGNLYQFTGQTLHRASMATRKGWRFFFRMSMLTTAPANQIRQQVQVYVERAGQGW